MTQPATKEDVNTLWRHVRENSDAIHEVELKHLALVGRHNALDQKADAIVEMIRQNREARDRQEVENKLAHEHRHRELLAQAAATNATVESLAKDRERREGMSWLVGKLFLAATGLGGLLYAIFGNH